MLNGMTRVIDDRSHLFFKNQSHLRLSWKVMRVLQLGQQSDDVAFPRIGA
jgi:hypothetical protein